MKCLKKSLLQPGNRREGGLWGKHVWRVGGPKWATQEVCYTHSAIVFRKIHQKHPTGRLVRGRCSFPRLNF